MTNNTNTQTLTDIDRALATLETYYARQAETSTADRTSWIKAIEEGDVEAEKDFHISLHRSEGRLAAFNIAIQELRAIREGY